jgi:hypothetical protein
MKKVCSDSNCVSSVRKGNSQVYLSADAKSLVVDRSNPMNATIFYLEIETTGLDGTYIIPFLA